MKIKNNKKASLVLLSLLLVGFLLVLSVGILQVILSNTKDTYSMKNSLKAFYGAESGLELALLRLKLKGFGYDYEIKNDGKKEVNVLASNILDPKNNKDVLINYKIQSSSNTASGTIESGESVIYPLFYKKDGSGKDFKDFPNITNTSLFKLEIITSAGAQAGLVTWGLIGKPNTGIKIKGINGTGTGGIVEGSSLGITKIKKLQGDGKYKLILKKDIEISDFLGNHTKSYLQILNLNNGPIDYKLNGVGTKKLFTGEETIITSSARIGKNKQNIEFKINNSKYLNIFRFTLYAPN